MTLQQLAALGAVGERELYSRVGSLAVCSTDRTIINPAASVIKQGGGQGASSLKPLSSKLETMTRYTNQRGCEMAEGARKAVVACATALPLLLLKLLCVRLLLAVCRIFFSFET